MKLSYYGHSCFAIELAGNHLLFDPFIRGNPLASAIDSNAVPADYILISHGHEDHLADAVPLAKRTGATVVSNFEICLWLGRQGVERTHPMNHGGTARFDFGQVKYVQAVHSSTLPDGSSGGNPGGFVVHTPEGRFYYAGDTALTLDMKLVAAGTPLRFAVLPVGDTFTMGVEDAIQAADFVNCHEIVGVHFDTFPPIKIDHAAAKERFQAAGRVLHLLSPGESREFR
jgi:L-ascorbate metabolism protein UlaG (beta-lactamase superfamily)